MKHIRSYLLPIILVFAFLLSGCAQSQKNTDVVVARVGDREITRREFRIAYNQELPGSIMSMLSQENPTEYLQNKVFNTLVMEAVLAGKFEEYGIVASAEEEAQLVEAMELRFSEIMDTARKDAEEENAANIEARALELAQEEINTLGFQSLDEYKAYILDRFRYMMLEGKLFTLFTKDITLSDDDLLQLFEKDVVTQKLDFTEDPGLYETTLYEYESGASTLPPFYVPYGLGYIKHILVEDEALAQELYGRLQQGEDFDALLEEYGTDPGLKEEPAKTRGYFFHYDSTNFAEEFRQGVLSLQEVGAYTEPVKSKFGYHIIKLIGLTEPKAISWEEVKDIYPEGKLQEVKSETFSKQVDAWIKETKVDSYIGRIRDIGAAS